MRGLDVEAEVGVGCMCGVMLWGGVPERFDMSTLPLFTHLPFGWTTLSPLP